MLGFVAAKAETSGLDDSGGGAMMAELRLAAEAVRAGPRLTVTADRLDVAARAFSGFAAVLQRQILPEAVAHGNTQAEAQLRWAVDAAMAMVSTLLAQAAMAERRDVELDLPPPPADPARARPDDEKGDGGC